MGQYKHTHIELVRAYIKNILGCSLADLQQILQRSPTDQTRIKLEPQLTRKQQEINELLKAEAEKLQQLRPVKIC